MSLAGNCRYRYTEQPLTVISCNPYSNNKLTTRCDLTIATNEEYIDFLRWDFVDESGNIKKLNGDRTGGKYTITETKEGSSVTSRLIVNNLRSSDRGSYYCQAQFSNGTSLQRSQELNLFTSIVYNRVSPCNVSNIASSLTSRCVLFSTEVVLSLPTTKAPTIVTTVPAPAVKETTIPPKNVANESTMAMEAMTVTGNGNGEKSTHVKSIITTKGGNDIRNNMMVPHHGEDIADIMLYSAIGIVLLLVITITILVLCICLCNRVCDCCRLCS